MPWDMRVFSVIDAKLAEHGLTTEATEEQMREAFQNCVAPQRCLRLAQLLRFNRRRDAVVNAARRFVDSTEHKYGISENSEFNVPDLRELANALDNLEQSGSERPAGP